MKELNLKLLSILTLILFVSCKQNFEEDGAGSSSLFSSHKPVTNQFSLEPPKSKTHVKSGKVNIVLKHPYKVTVSGTPLLPLIVGNSMVQASYISGSGTKKLTFRYVVSDDELDLDGITIGSAIDLNGGSITFNSGVKLENANVVLSLGELDGVNIDSVAPSISIDNTSIAAGQYLKEHKMQVMASFSENVIVTGAPKVELDIGGSTVYADYLTGSGGKILLFRYTISQSDIDDNGVEVKTVLLNGGTIKDLAGNDANLIFTSAQTSAIVDGETPYVINYTMPTNGSFFAGDILEYRLHFSEAVNVLAGTPYIELYIGDATKQAVLASGSGTDTLIFKYTVTPGDVDTNGATLGDTIFLNGATIQDSESDSALTTILPPLSPYVLVNAKIPTVQTITPPSDNSYLEGEQLYFSLNYNMAVDVTGIPRIPILLNSHAPDPVYATYQSGSGTSQLLFSYVVASGHEDHDGITLGTEINLNGGSITGNNEVSSSLLITSAAALLNTSDVLVDAQSPMIVSLQSPAGQTYTTGMSLDFTINYHEDVIVSGMPRIALLVGSSVLYANYQADLSSLSSLTFRYTVQSGDLDTNGISYNSTTIDLNGGLIKDANALSALLDFHSLASEISSIMINYDLPVITSITAPSNQYYKGGDKLSFTINTNVNINITSGLARLELDIGGEKVYADFSSGNGSSSLVFEYIIPSGYEDHDGISVTGAIDANGASLQDVFLNNLSLNFTPPDTSLVKVDSQAPYVVSTTKPSDQTYTYNQNLDFVLKYNENVTVTNTPRLALNIDDTIVYAQYHSGSGSDELTFRYTVTSGIQDTNGISFELQTIDINGGAIKDSAGNDSNLDLEAFTALPSLALINVDAEVPTLSSISMASNNQSSSIMAKVGDEITVLFTASEAIQNVTATIAGQAASVTNTSGNHWSAKYTMTSSESEGLVPFTINFEDLVGASGEQASAVTIGTKVTFDKTAPTITSSPIGKPADQVYFTGDKLSFTVTFSENVYLLDTPSIDVTIGSTVQKAQNTSASGNSVYTFEYIIQTSDYDDNGITISNLVATTGTIKDAAGNNAELSFTAPSLVGVTVNNGSPELEWYDSDPASSGQLVSTYDYGDPNANASNTFFIKNIGSAATSINFAITIVDDGKGGSGAVFTMGTDNCSGNVIEIEETCSVTINYIDSVSPNGLKEGSVKASDTGYMINPGYLLNVTGTN